MKFSNSKSQCKEGPCTPWINKHTLYSLHSLWFLWTIIFLGNPCYLSNWRMRYVWMNGTMLFLAKYLGFLFNIYIYKMQWLVSSNWKFLPRPKLDFSWSKPSYAVWLCFEFCQTLWPLIRNLAYSHYQDHVHIHSHAILPPLEDSNYFHPLAK